MDDDTLSEFDRLARRYGVAIDDELDEMAATITAGASRYDALDEFSPAGEPEADPAVRFDPGREDDPYNAFVSRFRLDGGSGPLTDMDVALKDNIAVAGVPLTCGSRVFEDLLPHEHASVTAKLLEAGASITGKTNMDELALGSTGETGQYGPTLNPATDRGATGGSSSGSAAAVATGHVDAALGSDTGGSIRIPASLCGVVGFKPSWGVVPRFGFVEGAYTLDAIGPLARDVPTAARVMDAIAGRDPRDPSTTRTSAVPVGEFETRVRDTPAVESLSLAVPEQCVGDDLTEGVQAHVERELDDLSDAGATVDCVSMPLLKLARPVLYAILNAEFAATVLHRGYPVRRWTGVDVTWQAAFAEAIADGGEEFGRVVREKILEGAYLLDSGSGREYALALNGCLRLRERFAELFERYDAVVTPTTPVTAPDLDEWTPSLNYSDEERAVGAGMAYATRFANLAGLPAVSVPSGTVDDRPIGTQFVGAELDDATVLQIGRAYEQFAEE